MKKNTTIVMAAGLALLGLAGAKVGFAGLLHSLLAGWVAVPILIGLGAARLGLQTIAWHQALKVEGIAVRTGDLIGARLASRGMGYLSVLGPTVAEPMRIKLLGETKGDVTAATLIDTGITWFSSGVVAIVASVCALRVIGDGKHSTPLLLLSVFTAAGLLLLARPKPVLPVLIRALGRRCPAGLKRAAKVELAMREFQVRHPSTIRWMLLLGFACQTLLITEIATIILVFKLPFHAGTIMALEAVNRLVRTAGGWLPARIGADETGMAAAFLMLGLPSTSGLAFALARRVRDLIEVLVGFCWMAWTARRPAAA